MDNELKQLIKLEGEKMTITSMDLCKLINILRKEEKGEEAKELRHANLIRSMESEIESLKNLEIAELNFELGSYIDSQNQIRPCYILNDEGMCDCISVSKYYRINYINKLA